MKPERAPYGIQVALQSRMRTAFYHASQINEAAANRNKIAEDSYWMCLASDVVMLCELLNQGAAYSISRGIRRG